MHIELLGSNTERPDQDRLEREKTLPTDNNFPLAKTHSLYCGKRAEPNVELCQNPAKITKTQFNAISN